MEPLERDRAIDAFRKGATRVLVTTNVLSRGNFLFTLRSAHGAAQRTMTYMKVRERCAVPIAPGARSVRSLSVRNAARS